MKIYSRYIFYKVLQGFAACISIFISLIWFSRAISFVKYVTENGVELSQFFYLFVLILPWLLLFIIPISLFAAILLVYNRLIATNEITILKNSGLTKFTIGRPVASLAIISAFFCVLISLYLMPYANKKLRVSRVDFHNNYTNLAIDPQTFTTLKNLTIYTKNRNENNQLFGILLHDQRSPEYSVTITARTGNIVTEDNSALLYMENGTVQKYNYADQKTEILNFDNYVFNLTDNKTREERMRWKSKERFLDELMNPEEDTEEEDLARYKTEIHQRLTYPLLPIVFSIIALSCILKGGFSRRGNISNIVTAIFLATLFLVITIATYDLIESSPKFIPVLYINFVVFSLSGLWVLNSNYRKKR